MGKSVHAVKGSGPGIREHPMEKPRGDGGGSREETGCQKKETPHIQSPKGVNYRGLVESISREDLNEPGESRRMRVGKVTGQGSLHDAIPPEELNELGTNEKSLTEKNQSHADTQRRHRSGRRGSEEKILRLGKQLPHGCNPTRVGGVYSKLLS